MNSSDHTPVDSKPIALITGASRGIGQAIARSLADDYQIIVGGTTSDSVTPMVEELPDAKPFVADLSDSASIAEAISELGLQRLDVLVHSAGLAWMSGIGDADHAQWQKMFAVNVFAVAEITRLVLPALREAHGQVVTINSGAGYTSRAGSGLYSGTKFALRAFSDALRDEEPEIRVISIHPGRVDTDMQVQLQRDMGNTDYRGELYIPVSAVADTVTLALEMDRSAVVEELSIRPQA